MKTIVLKFRYLPISSGNFCQITSNRKHSKSRRPGDRRQGSNPCCSAKPRGQVNFDSSVPSFLPAHRTRFVPCAESGDIAQAEAGGHRLRGGELGTVIQMRIDVGGGGEIAVTQPFLNLLHGNAIGQEQAGAGVPLRYNNDKRKKPLFSRGSRVCRHLFNSFSKLKSDEKNIKKRRLFH